MLRKPERRQLLSFVRIRAHARRLPVHAFIVVVLLLFAAPLSAQTLPEVWAGRAAGPRAAARAAVTVVAVGDMMLGTDFPDPGRLDPALAGDVDLSERIGAPLLALLRSGDVTFGNLEGPLADGGTPGKGCRDPDLCYVFRSPPAYAGLLREAGFTAVSLANNHGGDFGEEGRTSTMRALRAEGIAFAGLDRDEARVATIRLSDGTRVGLAAFAPNRGTLSLNDMAGAEALVRALAGDHDIVIVSFHGGAEGSDHTHVPREMEIFHGERRGDVHAFAHAMIDAGADVVLGHGPHVPRAVEVYRDRFVAYSLGNFWTYGRFNLRGPNGLAPVVELRLAPDGRLLAARVQSARQAGLGGPRLDPDAAAARLVAELTAEDLPETGVVVGADGTVSWPGSPRK
jgi:poly-gamma-glutamate capsule biosynthesis protein CapA/YwtB (metallophosphatase superfamily)